MEVDGDGLIDIVYGVMRKQLYMERGGFSEAGSQSACKMKGKLLEGQWRISKALF